MNQEVLNRFLKYVQVNTTSQENVDTIPSTSHQFDLANILVDELKEIGLEDVKVNDNCIVSATLQSNLSEEDCNKVPVICFLAHMDTSPEEPGENVKPQIIKSYQGGDIILPGDKSIIISPDETPSLNKFIGSDIITTDGTTLLGADNKAGIASIMTAISYLVSHSDRKHGTIKIVFTPDEEVGKGTDALDLQAINADYGYTMDGDEMGILETENFNAAGGTITIKGYNIHPGYAKDKMVNSIRILGDVINLFPLIEAPETTEKFEGFYHPYKVEGGVNETKLDFILRDFDFKELKNKMRIIEDGIIEIRKKHPRVSINLSLTESYRNMKEVIDKNYIVAEIAEEAIKRAGVTVINKPIRGGTDGARLCFKGLPTPNVFSGGINFHSKKEFVPLIAMEKAVETILNISEIFVERFLI
ncbi:MAG: peptidase T [Candidatus Hodarchaeales archaeon]|jgi:tripeptide aminopeptidase